MKTVRRPMTEMELEAAKCLSQVNYTPRSWDKRFAGSMAGKTEISEKEAPQVWRLFKRYRRQINHSDKAKLLEEAERFAAMDLREKAIHDRQQRIKQLEYDKYQKAMMSGL